MYYQVYYTDRFRERVSTVTVADSQQAAIKNIENTGETVNNASAVEINETEYNKFVEKWLKAA